MYEHVYEDFIVDSIMSACDSDVRVLSVRKLQEATFKQETMPSNIYGEHWSTVSPLKALRKESTKKEATGTSAFKRESEIGSI